MTIQDSDNNRADLDKLVWEKPEMEIVAAAKVTAGGGGTSDEDFSSFS